MGRNISCRVCGGRSRHIAEATSGQSINRCEACDLVFAHPLPTPKELTAFYQGFSYAKPTERDLRAQVRHTGDGVKRIVRTVEALGRPIGTVLDYGGGLGFFAKALSDHYDNVTLFDLDGEARAFARAQFTGRFSVVDSEVNALDGKYDLILVNQVIEHVPDPVAFLASLRGALADGGIMIVTTPNNRTDDYLFRPDVLIHYLNAVRMPARKAVTKLLTDSWLCCDPPRHLYAFNSDNLCMAGEKAGLVNLSTETAYFDEDPYGQPKYVWKGGGSPKKAAWSALFLWAKLTGLAARALDRRNQRGSTLIAYFGS